MQIKIKALKRKFIKLLLKMDQNVRNIFDKLLNLDEKRIKMAVHALTDEEKWILR
jgi:hypothetical protein